MLSVSKEGEERHIQGFILHKLYIGGYWGKGHTNIKNIPKGYYDKHKGKFSKQIRELKRIGLVRIFPHGGEEHVCAVLDPAKIEVGLELVNNYRISVGLPPLDIRFREILK